MGLLEQVKTGRINKPFLVLLTGIDGVGKSSWASESPKPIFLGSEDGTNFLDVARFPSPKNFFDILNAISELTNEPHEYQTLVIDSLDWMETLVWAHVCKENEWKSVEDPGYGKGYAIALDSWRKMISNLSALREKRAMNIILIAHTMIKTFNDPNLPQPYDRFQIKLQDKAAALFREFVDCVLFATYEIYIKEGKGGQKTKAFGGEKRVVYTERRAGFDAKNRLGLPFELPLSYKAFKEAAEKPDDAPTILASIEQLSPLVRDEKTKKAMSDAVIKAGNDTKALKKILEKAQTLTSN